MHQGAEKGEMSVVWEKRKLLHVRAGTGAGWLEAPGEGIHEEQEQDLAGGQRTAGLERGKGPARLHC